MEGHIAPLVHGLDERLPKVAVGNRLLLRVGPIAFHPPNPPPVAEAVDDVCRVAHHDQGPVESGDGLESRPDLHPLVGTGSLTAGSPGVAIDRPSPTAWSWIPGARTIGVDSHRVCGDDHGCLWSPRLVRGLTT